MEYSKLIHDYLDGQLGQSGEGTLFEELAQDAELRQEFNQQVNIHALAKSDMGSITPPADAANAIFSSLGFNIPSSEFVANGGASRYSYKQFLGNISNGFKKYFPNVLTATIAAVGTALIFMLFLDRFGQQENYANSNYPVVSTSEASKIDYGYNNDLMATASDAIPFNNSYDEQGRNAQDYQKENDFWKKQYFALVNSIKDDLSQLLAMNADKNGAEEIPFSDRSLSLASANNDIFREFNQAPELFIQNPKEIYVPSVYQNVTQFDAFTNKSDLSIELRNLQGYSLVNIDGVNSTDDKWFTNLAIAIAYNIGDNYTLGIEIGNERIAQEFLDITQYQTYTHKQNPSLTWYGGFVRKEFLDYNYKGVLYPYAQAFVGGAIANGSSEFYEHLGPLGKAQLGIRWQAGSQVTFNLGAEASWLLYQYQNNIYNTGKVGITYGVNIGL